MVNKEDNFIDLRDLLVEMAVDVCKDVDADTRFADDNAIQTNDIFLHFKN